MDITQLEGVWRSQGYNVFLVITKDRFTFYDYSRISCIPSRTGSMITFTELYDRFEFPDEDRFTAYEKGGITRYFFDRQAELPGRCQGKADDPVHTFDVFWHYFDENYAFFDLHGVDWNQVNQTFRPRVTQETTSDELFTIFSEMLSLLNDGHVVLIAGGQSFSNGKVSGLVTQWQDEFGYQLPDDPPPEAALKLRSIIIDDLLGENGKTAANGRLIWGMLNPIVGYLNVTSMRGFAAGDVPLSEQLASLGDAMAQVIEDFKAAKAVVVDVRFNSGGEDAASLLIASCFADKKRLAFTKKAVDGDTFTDKQEIYVQPQGKDQFTGAVYLLTSDHTASAAEIFTLSMMAFPHVTRMGESTEGILSDMLFKLLPNGWVVSISNEVYEAADGRLYEATGIPPQVEVPVFIPEFFYGGLELSVHKAVSLLEQQLIRSGQYNPPGLDDFITNYMETYHIPGLAACIIRDDAVIWSGGYGWADLDQHIPMKPDTLQNIGSISKTITATALMQLWEQGKFQLDDDINGYLPFDVHNPLHPGEAISFRQLLTHSSSIKDGPAYKEGYACGDPVISLGSWVKDYLIPAGATYDEKRNFNSWKPGENYDYSNVAFGLIGHLVEVISGKPFGDYCKANIFDPLGMDATAWYLADLDLTQHAVPYTYPSRGEIRGELIQEDLPHQGLPDGYLPNCLYSFPTYPDGGLRTSVLQLSRFLMAFMHKGAYPGGRLLREDTVREIFTGQLDRSLVRDGAEQQGLTWHAARLDNGNLAWGHGGGDPGITTEMRFCPTDNVGVIIFTNTDWIWDLMEVVTRLFQEATTIR